MKEYIYKVLWFDDEISKFDVDIDYALQHNIEIVGFDNSSEGLIELRQNYKFYDAIIVDGLFHKKANQKFEGLDQTAFGEVAKELFKMKNIGIVIPWFIYSGQKSFVKDKNDLVDVLKDIDFANGHIYDKNKDEDFVQLCIEIKKSASEVDRTKLRQKYTGVFEVCTEKYIGQNAADDLFALLTDIENDIPNKDFTSIRKIIEDIFKAFNNHQLLPDEFVNPTVSLNESSKFLSGKNEKGYQLTENAHIPVLVSNNIRNILSVCQPASHRSHIDDHINETNNNFLLKSLVFQLIDTIVWFKTFIDSNPVKNNWTKPETKIEDSLYEGIIEQDAQNNYYCGEYALNYNFTKDKFNIGDKIKITQWSENSDKRTMVYYQFFATRFIKIN